MCFKQLFLVHRQDNPTMSAPIRSHRINTDLLKLTQNNHEVTMSNNPLEFIVKFLGPSGTVYEGGIWNVKVCLSEDYPFRAPNVNFVNRIYHPNIEEKTGIVCLNVLKNEWTPLYDFVNIFEMFLPQLLADPNPTDPLNKAAAIVLIFRPEDYKVIVKRYVVTYASGNALNEEVDSDDSNESVLSEP